MTVHRIIVAGSRDVDEDQAYAEISSFFASHLRPDEIVSGGARGVDRAGEHWALDHSVKLVRFVPDWATHGKKAGPLRNVQMARYAAGVPGDRGELLAIWDGVSPGTDHMIRTATQFRLTPFVLIRDGATRKETPYR